MSRKLRIFVALAGVLSSAGTSVRAQSLDAIERCITDAWAGIGAGAGEIAVFPPLVPDGKNVLWAVVASEILEDLVCRHGGPSRKYLRGPQLERRMHDEGFHFWDYRTSEDAAIVASVIGVDVVVSGSFAFRNAHDGKGEKFEFELVWARIGNRIESTRITLGPMPVQQTDAFAVQLKKQDRNKAKQRFGPGGLAHEICPCTFQASVLVARFLEREMDNLVLASPPKERGADAKVGLLLPWCKESGELTALSDSIVQAVGSRLAARGASYLSPMQMHELLHDTSGTRGDLRFYRYGDAPEPQVWSERSLRAVVSSEYQVTDAGELILSLSWLPGPGASPVARTRILSDPRPGVVAEIRRLHRAPTVLLSKLKAFDPQIAVRAWLSEVGCAVLAKHRERIGSAKIDVLPAHLNTFNRQESYMDNILAQVEEARRNVEAWAAAEGVTLEKALETREVRIGSMHFRNWHEASHGVVNDMCLHFKTSAARDLQIELADEVTREVQRRGILEPDQLVPPEELLHVLRREAQAAVPGAAAKPEPYLLVLSVRATETNVEIAATLFDRSGGRPVGVASRRVPETVSECVTKFLEKVTKDTDAPAISGPKGRYGEPTHLR